MNLKHCGHFCFFLGETTALVNQVCEEHGIDLDDESDVSPSQSSRCDFLEDDTAVDLDELIGKTLKKNTNTFGTKISDSGTR